MASFHPAPEWDCSSWLNTPAPLSLAALRGKPIVAAAFQMLCPGCVAHTIPQLLKVHERFGKDVMVLGLHSVFEHHDAMREPSLKAFLHEYRVRFPVGVDRHVAGDPLPVTMRRYRFQGTPTLMLIDAAGNLRQQVFGHMPDLELGAEIMALLRDAGEAAPAAQEPATEAPGDRCEVGAGSC
ncbi:redoxin domain-containing protein [Sphingomonas sp. LM7]|uniref:redoxin domain-containing protein n=1 Tax=Sphingomonas sp. LM7 TaxID=1938607 RepID=UPI000983C136|nr:redoxin domain-containing protein [Sphingomonas sp. LM7]AQR75753.1 hypothetical protein BXU08_07640 [Sphingomonas sp. LM7]